MDIYDMLSMDITDPRQQQAQLIVGADEEMLDQLKSIRISKGLSLDDVAKAMGVSVRFVQGIENGNSDPHASTMRRYVYSVGAVVEHRVLPAEEAIASRPLDQ